MYHVYIIYSKVKDKFYIGQTEDVTKRLLEHNIRKNLGASDWEIKFNPNSALKNAESNK
jgi:predicted GIY-YIG superfamily endonuclease